LLTIGRGARVGIFGSPGTGKSTLLERIAAHAAADVVVVALIGERGREAAAWIDRCTRRNTIVCATSDRAASERIRAAEIAFAHAARLRSRGFHVLLIVDSLARYAYALRERRVALGEPAGRGGYPPGVFADLARLLESAGTSRDGSVTLLATLIPDGPGEYDPVCEAARSLLDGHLLLSAERAAAGRFPAIDIAAGASRTMQAVIAPAHAAAAATVRAAIARLSETREAREFGLLRVEDTSLERALAGETAIEAFLTGVGTPGPAAVEALTALAGILGAAGR
jgi:flagellar biosynthesis/type III secretory pathway ATPase